MICSTYSKFFTDSQCSPASISLIVDNVLDVSLPLEPFRFPALHVHFAESGIAPNVIVLGSRGRSDHRGGDNYREGGSDHVVTDTQCKGGASMCRTSRVRVGPLFGLNDAYVCIRPGSFFICPDVLVAMAKPADTGKQHSGDEDDHDHPNPRDVFICIAHRTAFRTLRTVRIARIACVTF